MHTGDGKQLRERVHAHEAAAIAYRTQRQGDPAMHELREARQVAGSAGTGHERGPDHHQLHGTARTDPLQHELRLHFETA